MDTTKKGQHNLNDVICNKQGYVFFFSSRVKLHEKNAALKPVGTYWDGGDLPLVTFGRWINTEEDGGKLKYIYINLTLKKIVVSVFTWSLAYLNGNGTSYCYT